MTGGIQLEERTLQRPASLGLTGEEWTVPVKKNRSRVNPPFSLLVNLRAALNAGNDFLKAFENDFSAFTLVDDWHLEILSQKI
ncbi:hypothetical protein TNCT_418251 [Trichonephila clavata]|uniref:Uncharacterized protein n=1 Tax=Trichonephila clavata TaxID=2740835 RepID=A0A8X6F560_TRICU|nr:hypothetical protein TNCT_418251 [Trichonephila clavata]